MTRTETQWWAWHDADQSRWSQTTEVAESRCSAWVAGQSEDGPEPVTIDVYHVAAGDTGAGGWDCDVTYGDVDGEATLLPSEHDGHPASWGQPDHWLSAELLRALPEDDGDRRAAMQAIETACREAIERSGIEPTTTCSEPEAE